VPTVFGRAGAVTAAAGDYTCGQVTGCTLNTTTVNGHALTGNVTVSAADITVGTLPHSQLPALVSGDIPNNAANTTGTAANLSGAPVLPSGTTATTQTAGDSSTKLATDGFVTANFAAMPVSGSVGDIPKISSNIPTPTLADSGVLAGPYPVPWITAVRGGGNATFGQNVVKMWGVVLSYPLLTSTVAYFVTAADAGSNNYDIGIASSSGTILVNVGATAASTFATAGSHTLSWLQAPKTLQPGKYYLVLTTNCASSCASITAGGSSADITFLNAGTAGTTSGGALGNFTPPADVWSWGANMPAVVVK